MIHAASTVQLLERRFGGREFSVKEAAEALPYTHGTTLVALSMLRKNGYLDRVKKGVYVKASIGGEHGLSIKRLKRPDLSKIARGYATATYALSTQLSPVSAASVIDIFVGLPDYPESVAAVETNDSFPSLRVHPFARKLRSLKRTIDGLKVTPPDVAFVDLIKIAVERRRPVTFEYEIVPFLSQLAERWEKVRELAEKEGIADHLEAIVRYVTMVAEQSGYDIALPKPHPMNRGVPRTLSFPGGKADDTSVKIGEETGIIVEADKEAVKGVLANL